VPGGSDPAQRHQLNIRINNFLPFVGRRIDNGDSYEDMHSVGDAVLASGIKRVRVLISLALMHPTTRFWGFFFLHISVFI